MAAEPLHRPDLGPEQLPLDLGEHAPSRYLLRLDDAHANPRLYVHALERHQLAKAVTAGELRAYRLAHFLGSLLASAAFIGFAFAVMANTHLGGR